MSRTYNLEELVNKSATAFSRIHVLGLDEVEKYKVGTSVKTNVYSKYNPQKNDAEVHEIKLTTVANILSHIIVDERVAVGNVSVSDVVVAETAIAYGKQISLYVWQEDYISTTWLNGLDVPERCERFLLYPIVAHVLMGDDERFNEMKELYKKISSDFADSGHASLDDVLQFCDSFNWVWLNDHKKIRVDEFSHTIAYRLTLFGIKRLNSCVNNDRKFYVESPVWREIFEFMCESSISKLAHSAFTKTDTFNVVKEEIKKINIVKEEIQKIFDKF